MKLLRLAGWLAILGCSTLWAEVSQVPRVLGPGEFVVTIVGTNDIHGRLETSKRDGETLGGFEWFSGMVSALRSHHAQAYPGREKVILLDAGDATQGTLLSNFSEGKVVMNAMAAVGYDAVIAGNHGYDFGPIGWLQDTVQLGATETDPLGALKASAEESGIPVLGANVRWKSSHEHVGAFPPYHLIEITGGRNLAVIGLENPLTPKITAAENVAGLEFSSGVQDLVSIVTELSSSGKADLFVVIFHQGDGSTGEIRKFLQKLPRRPGGEPLIDGLIAGHSHSKEEGMVGGIPFIQSYSGGTHFGLIQFVVGHEVTLEGAVKRSPALQIYRASTSFEAAIPVVPRFHSFFGQTVVPDPKVKALIDQERWKISQLGEERLGVTDGILDRNQGRVGDSKVGNFITDHMRQAAGTEVALINGGDIRATLPAGPITYEDLFQVMPTNNQLMVFRQLPIPVLLRNLKRSVRTCGRRGAMQVSGVSIEFSRDCSCPDAKLRDEDTRADIVKLTTTDGRVLYQKVDGKKVFDPGTVSVATTDFVMNGGAGYPGFPKQHLSEPPMPLRGAIAKEMKSQQVFEGQDYARGRYLTVGPRRCERGKKKARRKSKAATLGAP